MMLQLMSVCWAWLLGCFLGWKTIFAAWKSRPKSRRFAQLCLEGMEERLAPATLQWRGGNENNAPTTYNKMSVASNWYQLDGVNDTYAGEDNKGAPLSSNGKHTLIFNNSSNQNAVSPILDVDLSIASLRVEADYKYAITLNKDLTLNYDAKISPELGFMAAGTITGPGNLTLSGGATSGVFAWTGGTISGSGKLDVGKDAGLQFGGNISMTDRSLENQGNIGWVAGNVTLGGTATIKNKGTFVAASGKFLSTAKVPFDYQAGTMNKASLTTSNVKFENLDNGVVNVNVRPGRVVALAVPVFHSATANYFSVAGGGTLYLGDGGENSGTITYTRFKDETATETPVSTILIGYSQSKDGTEVNSPTFKWNSGAQLLATGGNWEPRKTNTLRLLGDAVPSQKPYPTLEVLGTLDMPPEVKLQAEWANITGSGTVKLSVAKDTDEDGNTVSTNSFVGVGVAAKVRVGVYSELHLGDAFADPNLKLNVSLLANASIDNFGEVRLNGNGKLYLHNSAKFNNNRVEDFPVQGRLILKDGATIRSLHDGKQQGGELNNWGEIVVDQTAYYDYIKLNQLVGGEIYGKGVFQQRGWDAKGNLENQGKIQAKPRPKPVGREKDVGFWLLHEINMNEPNQITFLPTAILRGEATVAWGTSVNHGTLTPSGPDLTGQYEFEGNFTQTASGTLVSELGGTGGVGAPVDPNDSDLVSVTGDVALSGTLSLGYLPEFNPSKGSKYLILDNKSSNPISGRFANYPQGKEINLAGIDFALTYFGGDGNDVELTSVSSFSGRAWSDIDHDGLQDEGEVGFGNVPVNAIDVTGAVVATKTTDGNGQYHFFLEPGTYQLRFDLPPNMIGVRRTIAHAGNPSIDSDADQTTGLTAQYTVSSTSPTKVFDCGLFLNGWPMPNFDMASTPINTAVLINVLSNDIDPDGDPLTITITSQPINGTATVNDNGTPNDPTDDRVEYVPNSGYTGPDTFSYEVSDGYGGIGSAWVFVNVTPPPANISGRAWHDANGNGIREAGDDGIGGLTVYLYNDLLGVLVATTTTAADGTYNFANVEVGTYRVQFTVPTGQVGTASNQGSDDTVDSDADLYGAILFSLFGTDLTNLDAGFTSLM